MVFAAQPANAMTAMQTEDHFMALGKEPARADLVAGNGLLPSRRNNPVDEALRQRLFHLRMLAGFTTITT